MSGAGTFDYIASAIEDFLGFSVAKILDGNNVLFRNVDSGRFAFSSDIWTYFRENYEELKASGAFG